VVESLSIAAFSRLTTAFTALRLATAVFQVSKTDYLRPPSFVATGDQCSEFRQETTVPVYSIYRYWFMANLDDERYTNK
jgi:hypothetical protein